MKQCVLFYNIITPSVRGHRAPHHIWRVINGENGLRLILYPLQVGGATMLANSLSHDVTEQYMELQPPLRK